MNAVILAGGRGRRMGKVTEFQQKCMINLDGLPLLERILDGLARARVVDHAIVATGHCGAQVMRHFGAKYESLRLSYVHSDDALEDRRRLLLAAEYLSDPFVFLAGDVVCSPAQIKEVADVQQGSPPECLGTVSGAEDHSPAPTHAVINAVGGWVQQLTQPFNGQLGGTHLREMGVSCLSRRLLSFLRAAPAKMFHVSHVLASLVERAACLRCVRYRGRWLHFATPEDFCQIFSLESLGGPASPGRGTTTSMTPKGA